MIKRLLLGLASLMLAIFQYSLPFLLLRPLREGLIIALCLLALFLLAMAMSDQLILARLKAWPLVDRRALSLLGTYGPLLGLKKVGIFLHDTKGHLILKGPTGGCLLCLNQGLYRELPQKDRDGLIKALLALSKDRALFWRQALYLCCFLATWPAKVFPWANWIYFPIRYFVARAQNHAWGPHMGPLLKTVGLTWEDVGPLFLKAPVGLRIDHA